MYSVGHSRIVATGVYLPEDRVSSAELMEQIHSKERFGISRYWLQKVTGIVERRVAPDSMLPSEMATRAAREALEYARVRPIDLDVLVYTGMNRDCLEPATAHMVQERVGAANAICFDVTNACHGFMNGIHLADALIATGQARYALIVAGESNWRLGRRTLQLLQECRDRQEFDRLIGGLTVGDAGAAVVLGPKTESLTGFIGFMLGSSGQYNELCVVTGREGHHTGHMDMVNIVKEHIQLHAQMYPKFMRKLAWRPEDIEHFVHHQVGRRVFALHARYSGVSETRMTDTICRLGNLTAATIPVNLHQLAQSGTPVPGEKVFIAGAGSGLSISQAGLLW